jgi:hypothetical protein
MAFFDKLQEVAKTIGDKTSETMKVVGDKTSDAVEITKQKAKISSEKSAIADVKKQIGELVWNKYSEGETVPEDVAALCATIQEHLDVIAGAEAEIENVKNKTGEDGAAAEDVQKAESTEEAAAPETSEESTEE